MRKRSLYKKTLYSGFALATLVALATPVAVISCSDSSGSNGGNGNQNGPSTGTGNNSQLGQAISNLNQDFANQLDKAIYGDSSFYQYTSDDVPKLVSICESNLTSAKNFLTVNEQKLDVNEKIWIKSLIDTIEVQKELFESNIHLMLVDSWGRLAFTNYTNSFGSSIFGAQSNFEKMMNKNQHVDQIKAYLQDFQNYLTKVGTNLKEGLDNETTISKVMAKHSIGSLLQSQTFNYLLDYYVQNSNTTPSFKEFISNYGDLEKNNLLLFTKTLEANANDQFKNDDEIKAAVESTDQVLFKLLSFIINEYFEGIKYGGTQTDYTLTVTTSKPNEEDNGYAYKDGNSTKYLKGLGLSETDLDTKDIGVGFTPNENGQKIYKALLRKHSSTTQSAKEIFDLGNNGVKDIKEAMVEVAKKIAEFHTGPDSKIWNPVWYYDKDSSGNQYGSEEDGGLIVDSQGEVRWNNFIKWLNSNQWFNGRDMTDDQKPVIGENAILSAYTEDGGINPISNWDGRDKNYSYISEYKPINSGITAVKISDVIGNWQDYYKDGKFSGDKANPTVVNGDAGNLAYKYLVQGLSPASIEISDTITNKTMNNSISPEAAFVGTSKAINQYLSFKDATSAHIASAFADTPVDWTLRTGTGGAAYADGGEGSWNYDPKGIGGFYLDSNPYFGLQKWSTSTLTSHEAISGHVFQFNYAHAHPQNENAPKFDSNAYSEGWGLFSEWLSVQLGIYGAPDLNNLDKIVLPQFGNKSKGVDLSKYGTDYANGAYVIDGQNSQEYYDAMQYFGFLNERQLRAMRCAVDVGIHAGGASISQDGTVISDDNVGSFKQGTGWSLNDSRKYLSSNSALGIDDINRETKRYLEYTGQAVSYYNGLMVIQDLFIKAANKYKQNHPNQPFLDWENPTNTKENTIGLFDVILRNGSIPLSVLEEAVNDYIAKSYN